MSQSTRWVFTLNNFTDTELSDLKTWVDHGVATFIVFQHERGDNGTDHLQGYARFRTNQRLSAVRKLLDRGHWETARGAHDQCVEYCTKGETRVGGPWTFGDPPVQGQRSDLDDLAAAVRGGASDRELARDRGAQFIRFHRGISALRCALGAGERRAVATMVYIGGTGAGKTWRCYEEEAYVGAVLPYRPVVTRDKIWFDGYQGEEGILFDDWVGAGSVAYFLQLLDIYPLFVEVKGGTIAARWKRVYITSNLDVPLWWEGSWSPGHYQALNRRLTRVEYM